GLASALFLALVGGFAGVGHQWRRAAAHLEEVLRQRSLLDFNFRRLTAVHQELAEAMARERTARRRAQARFALAVSAVNGFSNLAREEELFKDENSDGLRNRLLDQALVFYKALEKELAGDPTRQAQGALSAALARVASIQLENGSKAEALDAYVRALEIVKDASAADPAEPALRSALARSHYRVGLALGDLGRPTEARRAFEQSRAILEALVRDHPASVPFRDELAW